MLNSHPDHLALWTDAGRNDAAAHLLVTPMPDDGLRVTVSEAARPLTFVALRWRIPVPAGTRVLGDHWERGYGDLEWRGLIPERVLPWYALVHEPKTGETHGYGVDTGASSLASWRLDEQGLTLVLDVRNGGGGVHLGHRELHAATVRSLASQPGESAFAFASRFCRRLCASPRLPAYPLYGGNDWYYRYGLISEQTVRQDASIIRELATDTDNAPAYVIDAGWFPEKNCDGGPYDRGHEGFPDLPGLAAWMKREQIRPGIWIRPLLTGEKVPESWRVPARHPLHNSARTTLDPTIPEVLERIRTDTARLTRWGYDIIKHDFTTYDLTGRWGFAMGANVTDGGWSFADNRRTNAEIIRTLYATIREGAGDASLIGCNTVGHLGAGLFELQRTGNDTSGLLWEKNRRMGPNTLAFRMPQHGAFFAVDADCVGLTQAVPWEYNRQWLDLLARSGTPLFVSPEASALGTEQRAALTAAFARAAKPAPPAEPLDWLETTCPRQWRFGSEVVTYDWVSFADSAFDYPTSDALLRLMRLEKSAGAGAVEAPV